MSFEPTLIIRKSDLEKNRSKIEEISWLCRPESKSKKRIRDAYRELNDALKIKPVKFPEIEFVIIKPELTSHNKSVRELLDELNIDYRIDV